MNKLKLLSIFLFCCLTGSCQVKERNESNVTGPAIHFKEIGQIKIRSTHEIESSNWYVGGETMDRDYTVYRNWKDYVEPLGIKKIRIQGGWAKTERERGK